MLAETFFSEIRQDASFQGQISRTRARNTHFFFSSQTTESALHLENLENRLVFINRNKAQVKILISHNRTKNNAKPHHRNPPSPPPLCGVCSIISLDKRLFFSVQHLMLPLYSSFVFTFPCVIIEAFKAFSNSVFASICISSCVVAFLS